MGVELGLSFYGTHMLRMFENKLPRKIYGHEKEDVK
jgi:hypothetical protein